ncbi:Isopentenyl-diphosphate Delta-isomerase II [Vitis vinifera]|uniref:isopentenyl-diphosphate Delta-isomerase n=1 Tax=Vitis vinifera TaxID=29760 RepID=A0A438JE22_VITVI|nr:Isopentenyl-diphosphate Delta-isomerase II [Vitis vinifera]
MDWNPCFSRNLNDWELDNVEACFSRLQGRFMKREEKDRQRSATKVTFPLVWTNTCCSHPLYRESELIDENALGVRNAAQRKLLDELGIPAEDASVDQFTPLGRMLYKAPSDGKWGEHELDYLLFIVRDVNVNPNPDEVADVKLVVDNFLFKWWDHVEKGTLLEAADMKTIHKLT